jgi:hypothetical protein
MHVSQTISMIHRDASFHRVCESLCVHGIGFTWFTECMYASQTLSMIHRDALFHRVCESLCVHGSHVGLIYRYYLFHRVHVWFTDIEHDSQRCFVLQSLLLFRRVFFHRVRVCFTDFHRYDFGPFDVWSVCFKEHCCFTVFADCSQSLSKKWFTEFGKSLFTVFHFIHRVLFHRVCILIHREKNVF